MMSSPPIVERAPPLPPDATAYRRIGPFTSDTIPAGLLREHRLKADAWALLHIASGSIRFCWDDTTGGHRILAADDTMLIPPQAPHHLDRIGPVSLTIEFCAS